MSVKTLPHNPALDFAKFLFILGVVLIHCNPFDSFSPQGEESVDGAGMWMVIFISSKLCSVAVPCFFIISGFLFFRNMKKYDIHTWSMKMKSRSRTLLVPYLLWNLFGCALLLVKARWLGFPSYGVIEEGNINIGRLLEGFVNFHNGYPYAFAFWFIRNLIVFVIISPIAFLLAQYKWLFTLFMVAICATDFSPAGFEYFTLGGFLGIHYPQGLRKIKTSPAVTGGVVWVALSWLIMQLNPPYCVEMLMIFSSAGAFIFIIWCADRMGAHNIPNILRRLVQSTFFIYAIHQFFCSAARNFYISVFGLSTFPDVTLYYLSTFLTLTVIPFFCWLGLRRFTPRLTSVLGGGR